MAHYTTFLNWLSWPLLILPYSRISQYFTSLVLNSVIVFLLTFFTLLLLLLLLMFKLGLGTTKLQCRIFQIEIKTLNCFFQNFFILKIIYVVGSYDPTTRSLGPFVIRSQDPDSENLECLLPLLRNCPLQLYMLSYITLCSTLAL